MSTTRVIEQLLAKTKIFWQTQFLNSAHGMQELFALMIIFGQKQNILTAVPGQFGRQNQKVRANRIQGGSPIFFGQTQPFEPVDYIGGKQKQLKERYIGFPGVAGNFAQRIIVKEFAVVLFYSGSGIVKQIYPPGRHLEIGYENMVNIPGILEQSQLFGFLRILRNGTPNHNKTMRAVPFLMNIVFEFSGFPAVVELAESASLRFGFENRIFLGYDDIPAANSVEETDYSLTVESGVHTEANAAFGNIRRSLVQAHLQELDGSSRGSGVPRTQSSVPEFLAMRFEAEQWVITSSSMFLGIVTDSTTLLFAVNRNHHRIDIESQTGAFAWQVPQVYPQTVVQSGQLTNRLWAQSLQESSQGCLVRETAQSQNLQEKAVVLQDFGLVDPFQPHDYGIQQCQDQLGRMVNLILLGKTNRLLQKLFEPKLLAKTVNQKHSAIMSQVAAPEENFDFSLSFWHNTQTVHFGRFLCGKFDKPYYTPFPSENTNLKSQNNRFSRIFED